MGNAKFESEEEIKEKVFTNINMERDDIIIFSLQEIVKLNAMNVIYKSKNTDSVANWSKILSTLTGEDFYLVSSKSLVGMLLVIYAKKGMKSRIRDVSFASKKLGFNNNFGNKGAVAIRMDIDHSKL